MPWTRQTGTRSTERPTQCEKPKTNWNCCSRQSPPRPPGPAAVLAALRAAVRLERWLGLAQAPAQHHGSTAAAMTAKTPHFSPASDSGHEKGPVLTSLRAVASSVGPVPNDGHHRATPQAPHAGLRA